MDQQQLAVWEARIEERRHFRNLLKSKSDHCLSVSNLSIDVNTKVAWNLASEQIDTLLLELEVGWL